MLKRGESKNKRDEKRERECAERQIAPTKDRKTVI